MKKYACLKAFFLALLLLLTLFAKTSHAQEFSFDYLLGDEELFDFESMHIAEIFSFLREYNSSLQNQFFLDYQGKRKNAATIIYQASLEHKINPKFLLAIIQKEQGLVENFSPAPEDYDWAAGYGVCDGCDRNLSGVAQYRGFGMQVNALAEFFKQENGKNFRCHALQSCAIDGIEIIPKNAATAKLYSYTPHLEGNRLFWQIWQKYWKKDYPDGSLIQAFDDDDIWYIQEGKKRKIASRAVLLSRFHPNRILRVTQSTINKYENGEPIRFSNYTLMRTPNGRIYLFLDDTLRYITSPEVFRTIGFNADEVVDVDPAEISPYSLGENITLSSAYPTGAVVQNKKTQELFYVINGNKMPIYSREILASNFSGKKIIRATPGQLEKFHTGDPLKFKDGDLIKSSDSPAVYVVSGGKRRPFRSGQAFENLGYMWDNIVVTNNRAIEIHPLGEILQ